MPRLELFGAFWHGLKQKNQESHHQQGNFQNSQSGNHTNKGHYSTNDLRDALPLKNLSKTNFGDQDVHETVFSTNAERTECSHTLSHQNSLSGTGFPEGGLRAWLVVFGSFLGLTNCFGTVNSTAAIETYIAHNQLAGESASVVGWIFSIYNCFSLLFGVFVGHFFDTQGPRIPVAMGGVLTFAGVFATGNCTETYQFILAFSCVAGIGMAVQMSALVGIIPHYFQRRRGTALGLASVGGSVGGAVFPLMLRLLYSRLGFTWAMRIFGILLGMLDIGAFLLIKPRFPSRKAIPTPNDILTDPTAQRKKSFRLRQHLVEVREFFMKSIDLQAFRDPRFTFCTLGVLFGEVFLIISLTYYGSYALFKGNSESTTYLLITIMNAAGIVARAAAGILSDKLGKFNLMSCMILSAAVFCLAIWLPFGKYPTGLYVFSVADGIATSAVFSLTPLCVSQICRVEDFGRKYSTCYFVVALGTLVGIPISGLFIGKNPTDRNYDNFIIFVSMMGFVSVAFFFVSRYYAVKFKLCIY